MATRCRRAETTVGSSVAGTAEGEGAARWESPSPGSRGRSQWVLGDVDVSGVEDLARRAARRLGRRPRTTLAYFQDPVGFAAACRADDRPSLATLARVRGECRRGPGRGQRLIFIAPAASRRFLLESLTHEMAHALTPWREHHSPGWLALHLAVLGVVCGPVHAARVRARAYQRYPALQDGDGPSETVTTRRLREVTAPARMNGGNSTGTRSKAKLRPI